MPNTYRTTAEIVALRTDDQKKVCLHLTDLSLFASGVFSNVYKGVAEDPETTKKTKIVIKKTWPRHKEKQLEVKILERLAELHHKNVVQLLYSYTTVYEGNRTCLSLIFEFIPLNMHQYLKKNNRQLDIVEVKLITWQLFRGLWHLQRYSICHRDIKPQNLLFNEDTGLLKISDFGSSSMEPPSTAQHSYHVTRYYRPPELLLGSRHYGCEVDIWSGGCVFGELLKGGILLAGRSTTKQAEVIFDVLGLPSKDELKAMRVTDNKYQEALKLYEPDLRTKGFTFLYEQSPSTMKDSKTLVKNAKISVSDMKQATKLLRQIFVYTPDSRLGGSKLLNHEFFANLHMMVRENGRLIECLSADDFSHVSQGDTTFTEQTKEATVEK
uniref:Protein kinase domain-containing protein n=1 Tax=Caenorhabditis tropicalis TaxID=1561998 RepID=A0A1I7UMT7_9PELO